MIKFIIAFRPPAQISVESSQAHYRDSHGPLIRDCNDFCRHVLDYVQNETLTDLPQTERTFAGVSELWFESWAQFDGAFGEPVYQERIRPDELRFASLDGAIVVFADDTGTVPLRPLPAAKLFIFRSRRSNVSQEEFREVWQSEFASQVRADKDLSRAVSHYVQNRSLPADQNPFPLAQPLEGGDEFWLDDPELISSVIERQRELGEASGLQELVGAETLIAATPSPAPGFAGSGLPS